MTLPPLVHSGNNLLDVINWLKLGYFVCIHDSYHNGQIYYSKESLEIIGVDDEIVFIDCDKWSSLLEEDEWPYYIKDAGFVKYKNNNMLPKKEHNFTLP